MNKIVYDVTLDPPAQSKDLNPKDYGIDVLPYYVPTGKTDTTLVFESRFQSGNLRRAIQLLEYEYQLILKSDWNTIGHTQWFYFSVSNVKKNVDYRFNMINMTKQDSLYNVGMRPLMYSEKQAKHKSRNIFIQKLVGIAQEHKYAIIKIILKEKVEGFIIL